MAGFRGKVVKLPKNISHLAFQVVVKWSCFLLDFFVCFGSRDDP